MQSEEMVKLIRAFAQEIEDADKERQKANAAGPTELEAVKALFTSLITETRADFPDFPVTLSLHMEQKPPSEYQAAGHYFYAAIGRYTGQPGSLYGSGTGTTPAEAIATARESFVASAGEQKARVIAEAKKLGLNLVEPFAVDRGEMSFNDEPPAPPEQEHGTIEIDLPGPSEPRLSPEPF